MDIKCEIVDIVDKCPPTNYLPTENFSSPVKDTKIKHTSLQGMNKTKLDQCTKSLSCSLLIDINDVRDFLCSGIVTILMHY